MNVTWLQISAQRKGCIVQGGQRLLSPEVCPVGNQHPAPIPLAGL